MHITNMQQRFVPVRNQVIFQCCISFNSQTISGKGFDRHLLGLNILAKMNRDELPSIFTDATYAKSIHFSLSTSQVQFQMNYLPVAVFLSKWQLYCNYLAISSGTTIATILLDCNQLQKSVTICVLFNIYLLCTALTLGSDYTSFYRCVYIYYLLKQITIMDH